MISTDLRWGLHWSALPTLIAFGELEDENGKKVALTVGAGSSNHIGDTEARVELLEFTGAGLSTIKAAVDDLIATMGNIGASMLQDNSKGVKAAETARIEQGGKSATLSTIAQSVENGITSLLTLIAGWYGIAGETKYELNKDFIDSSITPQELTSYLQAYQSDAISLDTFLNLLFRGELLPKGTTVEDEKLLIEAGTGDFDDEE